MAFPRRFKRELWYLRLPSGEVEIATAEALQRSFECGLVDHRTPVRAFAAHAWITMQEAAELPVPPPDSVTSLSPTAYEPPAMDLAEGARWQSRSDVDPSAFKPSRIPAILGLTLAFAFLGIALLRVETPLSPRMAALQLPAPIAPLPKFARPPILEHLHTPRAPVPERWTKEERHRHAELEYIAGLQPSRPAARPRVTKPAKPAHDDPFGDAPRTPRRGDPLDGSI